jgi:transcriptional regulator with GAF, ATPase, and Fis domain
VFRVDGDRLVLYASRGIDQAVLDAVPYAWREHRATLTTREPFYVAERESDRRLPPPDGPAPVSLVLVPVFHDDAIVALLYVDSLDPHFCAPHDLERLEQFARIVAKAVVQETAQPVNAARSAQSWETYLERTPVEDMEREKLLLLLNRNEWNIARVARLMGVTRRTVYLRLQRYNIPRERVPKGRPRARA